MATNTTTQHARILTKTQIGRVRHILPEGWLRAAGMLKEKKKQSPIRYQQMIRKEWARRLKKMTAL